MDTDNAIDEDPLLSLYLPFGDHCIKALIVPKSTVMRMSTKPLKWLRFLGYLVLNAEGKLYDKPNNSDAGSVDYSDDDLHSEYYYDPGK